jgi:hypothetical protein
MCELSARTRRTQAKGDAAEAAAATRIISTFNYGTRAPFFEDELDHHLGMSQCHQLSRISLHVCRWLLN